MFDNNDKPVEIGKKPEITLSAAFDPEKDEDEEEAPGRAESKTFKVKKTGDAAEHLLDYDVDDEKTKPKSRIKSTQLADDRNSILSSGEINGSARTSKKGSLIEGRGSFNLS